MVHRVLPEINVPRPGAVLLVGRDPGEDEEIEGRPFVGRAGMLLDQVLSETGLRRQDVNIANVCEYRPPENKFALHTPLHVEMGLQSLQELRSRLKPSLTIALGNEASYALVGESWPTRGRGIYGAKSIEDRRGYFWETPQGWVLTALHPAGVLRKPVPGEYLLTADFHRARKWLHGELPRETFPEVKQLSGPLPLHKLMHSQLVAWDIETKWDMTALLCCGFCGDDRQPYVAVYPYEYRTWAEQILRHPVPKVGHNGLFDLAGMKVFEDLTVQGYRHDTQHMWWALEPELAGTDETGGGEQETFVGRRLTRKGLAFLGSLYFNVPWWKNYPENDDPEHLAKMVVLNGRDAWVTRELADALLAELEQNDCMEQYQQAMRLYPALLQMQLRGLRVDETLRAKREELLRARAEEGKSKSVVAGLEYITTHDLPSFRKMRRCECCGGGRSQAKHCIRCAGLFTCGIPEKITRIHATTFEYKTIKAFKESWPPCETCGGTGKIKQYAFNPYSEQQLKTLLYGSVGVPKHTWKGKITTDDSALRKIMRWVRGIK